MLKLCSADSCYFPSFQIEGSKIYFIQMRRLNALMKNFMRMCIQSS